jgi:hypothetical protein
LIAPEGHYQPFWIWPATFGGIGGIVLLFWALNRLMGRYFPGSRGAFSAGGNALMRVEATFLPGREHQIEAQERDDAEEDDSGDPPVTSGEGNR